MPGRVGAVAAHHLAVSAPADAPIFAAMGLGFLFIPPEDGA
jgi:hypothetical protein